MGTVPNAEQTFMTHTLSPVPLTVYPLHYGQNDQEARSSLVKSLSIGRVILEKSRNFLGISFFIRKDHDEIL